MAEVQLQVNGIEIRREVPDQTLLVEFLREVLRHTGTHVGCDTSQCGACTVNLDGVSVKSCTVLAAQASGGKVVTVEGLPAGENAALHPVQNAFIQCHGLQCGFCTPGMIMAVDFYLRKDPYARAEAGRAPLLDEVSICHALEGNICRCTGYVNIIEAVRHAAHAMYQESADSGREGRS
jgi:carbon-monoxide dehydrogenase small subunit